MTFAGFIGLAALLGWLYLLLGRGFFWLARERDGGALPEPKTWPAVTAIVPARDEADVIACSIKSLLAQDYAGLFRVILIDDQSADGTAAIAQGLDSSGKLRVLSGAPRPPGWTGKLWAVQQGIGAAGNDTDYFWLTDADITHAPDNLRQLVMRAQAGRLAMVSLMARLRCESWAERMFVPAFVFFFAMLYPFAWVNKPGPMAAAAGGCMLVRRKALEAAGGIAAIRGDIIDDCALGRAIKAQGPIWLGLTDRALSLRPYEHMADIRQMVSRSAYAQLNYSPLLLATTLLGMALLYAAPPLLAVFAGGPAQWTGAAAWAGMTAAFQPMLRFYRRSPIWGLFLPVIGIFYTMFTMDSALQHWRGRGGMWKGRAQSMAAKG